ncbi:potassium/proton antiporter [Martelella sp. HB161492]|uniref:potassium/proton antiporter n=1 Tax=Martelella sp. HB161492 TaxID=2720726 RepID=UPI0015924CA7|nr:potassium/proton antiporter [Martelella sp. HB161492]
MTIFYVAVLVCACMILLAALSSALAYRFGAPLLVLFLGVGLLAGTDGLGIEFDNTALTYYVGSLALAIILFDSGFGTAAKTLRKAAVPALLLATLGVALTAVLVACAAHFVFDFSLAQGLLLGSIVASTDAAAVFFLMRIGGIHVVERVSATLELESGINDPMAIFLTLTIVTLLAPQGHESFAVIPLALSFLQQLGFGLVFGLAGGGMIVFLVNRFGLNRGLTPILVLALALIVFSATGAAGGSGYLAVYVAGLYAGNKNVRYSGAIRHFQEGMTWLAQIIMFVLLGLLATPRHFDAIIIPALAMSLFLVFIARPLAVWLCLLPFNYRPRETKFISLIGLRGAVSILLALLPILYGLPMANDYFNIVFVMVLTSLVLQGWSLAPLAKRWKLVTPVPAGPIEHVEIDLPGEANHELVVYALREDCPVLTGTPIPRWAVPSLVIRDGQSTRFFYAGELKAGDYLYLFIEPGRSPLLDRLFSVPKPLAPESDPEMFGSDTVLPTRPMSELEALGSRIKIAEAERSLTVAAFMNHRLGARPAIADRVEIGPLSLIVREINAEGEISAIGIWLETEAPPGLPIFMNFREIMRLLTRRHARTRLGKDEG